MGEIVIFVKIGDLRAYAAQPMLAAVTPQQQQATQQATATKQYYRLPCLVGLFSV